MKKVAKGKNKLNRGKLENNRETDGKVGTKREKQ